MCTLRVCLWQRPRSKSICPCILHTYIYIYKCICQTFTVIQVHFDPGFWYEHVSGCFYWKHHAHWFWKFFRCCHPLVCPVEVWVHVPSCLCDHQIMMSVKLCGIFGGRSRSCPSFFLLFLFIFQVQKYSEWFLTFFCTWFNIKLVLGRSQFVCWHKDWVLILTIWVVGQLFLAKRVLRLPTATLTAVHKQDTGLADSTGFVHDWLSSLHISHHAVISSAATSLPVFCFFSYVSKPCFSFCYRLFLLCPAHKGSSTRPHGEGGLAGPSDLQRNRDDQWGELTYSDMYSSFGEALLNFTYLPVGSCISQ